jgi:DNA mismatch repair protein MutL
MTHSRIEVLPLMVANQIAAGEVVERPASVIKELLENSIDAGATEIDIEVINGGLSLLKVRDNGHGIVKEDLPNALHRHATSKIKQTQDLENIASLGFRGEALASIASVAKVQLASKSRTQSEAWQCELQGQGLTPWVTPVAHPPGTTVAVRDIFYNTPVRRKFMKSPRTEWAQIEEMIKRLALGNYPVKFTLTHNHKLVRCYPQSHTLAQQQQRLAKVYGNAFLHHATYLDFNGIGLKLWGWVLPPAYSRRQADCQCLFVNHRLVRAKLVTHAIQNVFYSDAAWQAGTYPAYVLYLELPASDIDVNVHPTKHEVRFHSQRLIHDFVTQCLQKALAETTPLAPKHDIVTEPSSPTKAPNNPALPPYSDACVPKTKFAATDCTITPSLMWHRDLLLVSMEEQLLVVNWPLAKEPCGSIMLKQCLIEKPPQLAPLLFPLLLSAQSHNFFTQHPQLTQGFSLQKNLMEQWVVTHIPEFLAQSAAMVAELKDFFLSTKPFNEAMLLAHLAAKAPEKLWVACSMSHWHKALTTFMQTLPEHPSWQWLRLPQFESKAKSKQ